MNNLKFTPFPILTTDRLTLRQLSANDDKAIFNLRSDDQVNKYLDRPKQKDREQAKAFINKINLGIKQDKWIYWAITMNSSTELIGTICLWNFSEDKTIAEIGYELRPEYQGKGIMKEAIVAVINYAFKTIKLKALKAYTHKRNIASTKLLKKNGFKLAGDKIDGENESNIVYVLTFR